LSARGDLYVPRLDPMTVEVRGALHKDHLQIDELDLGAFGGHALLAGNTRWSPEQSWELAGDVRGFDPATLRPGFDGALDFRLEARGAPFATSELDVAFSNVSGKLRGTPAGGGGRVHMAGDDWTFDAVRLRAGATNLSLDGTLGPNKPLDLAFSIDADDLGLLAEGARGTLHARGKIAGSSGAPLIKLDAQGANLEHGDTKLDKLAANIDIDWRGQRVSHADIALSRLEVGSRALTQFNAVMDGTTGDHKFKIDALAVKTSLHLTARSPATRGAAASPISSSTTRPISISSSMRR
jgi:autotransporter translocation and assembly factor TamB